MKRPSLLPEWSVGQVLAHMARNADSHKRRAEAAARGVVVEQYPGGFAGRAAEIDRDSRRPAAFLIRDVHESGNSAHRVLEIVAGRGLVEYGPRRVRTRVSAQVSHIAALAGARDSRHRSGDRKNSRLVARRVCK